MAKFRVVCYKPKFDGHLVDNLIDLWTRFWNVLRNPSNIMFTMKGRYKLFKILSCSHIDIEWIDEGEGITFTSTRGQANTTDKKIDGSVIRPSSEAFGEKSRHFYFEFECPQGALDFAIMWAEAAVKDNKGYDNKDILKYFELDKNKRVQNINDGKLICSGAGWAFIMKVALRWSKIERLGFMESVICDLTLERNIKMLPSPLLLAIWCYMTKTTPKSLETNKSILKGK